MSYVHALHPCPTPIPYPMPYANVLRHSYAQGVRPCYKPMPYDRAGMPYAMPYVC